MKIVLRMVALAALVLAPAIARADTAASVEAMLSARTVAARDAAMAELDAARAADPLAAYAAGTGHFFAALETLAQGLHRHGFESPRSFMLPLMRLPIPDNPAPEPLTYEGFRQILTGFRDRLGEAEARFAGVPATADIGVVADLAAVGIDLDRDGAIEPEESIAAIMAGLAGGGAGMEPAPAGASMAFRFDRADGYWLQGYARFLMAQADFWLAHDFRLAFDQSFHMLFPRAGLPMQAELVPLDDGAGSMFASEWRIADFISMIHLVNWPVVEPERRMAARTHLLEMIRLSRENWKAIRAETDNDREWLPGPQQPGVHALTGLEVTETEVQAWHAAIAIAEDLLEGRRLLPHFRFADRGIDMKKFFVEPQTFDLVLSITGPAIVPFLAQGDILDEPTWSAVQNQFGGAGFMTFALWFN